MPAGGRRPPSERAEFVEQCEPVADPAPVRRIDEREVLDLTGVAEPEGGHLQQHGREVGAGDLGVGERRPAVVVLLRIQADADAVLEPPAAAGPLQGRCLRNALDRQPLDLGAEAVARDARVAGVDDVADPRHGQRGLGDVGGQHYPAAGMRREDAMLLGDGQPGVERDDLVARAGRRP